MTYSEAKDVFEVRLYRWAKATLDNEIEQSFPSFGPWNHYRPTCRFIERLEPNARFALTAALLEKPHRSAFNLLGERVPAEGQKLLQALELFLMQATAPRSNACRAAAGTEKAKYPRGQELRKALLPQFKKAFAHHRVSRDEMEERGGSSDFMQVIAGWFVRTNFSFGRWEPEIISDHQIWNGRFVSATQPEVLPANSLRICVSYGGELGIGSLWDCLTADEVEPASQEVVEHCRKMFGALPALLAGLEPETLAV